MLVVEKMNTFYGDAHVLFDVSLEIREGEVVALLGRNGAGKTTTIRSIMGLTPPRTGRVIFKGENIATLPPYVIANRGVGFVPDNRRIFPTLTVRQNLELARKQGDGGKNGWTLEGIYEHFPALKEIEDRKGEVLSGGEQQMLTIARTLMGNPDLVLLDEPTEGLAPIMVMEVMKIIKELKEKGETILLVEQNSTLALGISQRAYILENGHVVYSGPAEDLIRNDEVKQKYLGI
ncbi:MAG: ABC transporter ATP-binding protein [Candidatus Rokubacteria bacterium]|nr:ABC transporter ATP-binding protein [Candidatus Rokubacteria bacterium]